MTIEAGQVIGNCVLRRRLADGGMGSVWIAWHSTEEQEVAVKFLANGPIGDGDSAKRFSLEACIAARIRSSHVPEVFDHGVTESGTPFLIMELLDGVDLTTWMAQHRPLPLPDVVSIVDQVGLALSAAHQLGIVHRDVKPSNIIVDASDDGFHAYLIDFGIAKSTHASLARGLTHPGTTIGTPTYMSPEQLMGANHVDERADMWSLGVVAYYCLTGSHPFVGATFSELCFAIYSGRFVSPSKVRADAPPALDAWFDKTLHVDQDQRFRSVIDMSEAFRAAMAGRSIDSVPRRLPSRLSLLATDPSVPVSACVLPSREAPRRSSRFATAACAVGGAVLGAGAAFFIVSSNAHGAGPRPRASQATMSARSAGTEAAGALDLTNERADGGALLSHSDNGT
jgi:serine/threonine protein kinase